MPEYKKLDKEQAALLLVDHQSGLISLVQDYHRTSSRIHFINT